MDEVIMSRYKGIRKIKNKKGNTYEISYQVAGKRYQYRVTADSQKEADYIRTQDIASRIEKNKNKFQEIADVPIEMAYEKFIDSIIADGRDRKTIYHYIRTFGRLYFEFREKEFPEIQSVNQTSVPFLNQYKIFFVNTTGNHGLWAEVTFVKAMIRKMIGLGLIRPEFERELKKFDKPPKGDQKEFPIISDYKFKKFFRVVKKERPDMYPLLFYIFSTGRRIEESTLIEKKDLEINGFRVERIRIKIQTTKQKKKLHLRCIEDSFATFLFRTYVANKNKKCPYLFVNRSGNKFHPNRVRDYLADVSERVLEERITPHYFRHRAMTLCSRNGVGIRDAMAITGLMSIDIALKYYTHETEEGVEKGLNALKLN